MKKLLYKWDKYKLGRRLHYLQKRLVRAESNGYDEKIAEYLNEKVRRKAVAQYIHRLIVASDITGYDFNLSDSPLMQ